MPGPYSVTSDSAGSGSGSGHTSPFVDGLLEAGSSSLYSHSHATRSSLYTDTLTDEEIGQIASFYQGLYSQTVYVCPAVAALYLFADPALKQSQARTGEGNHGRNTNRTAAVNGVKTNNRQITVADHRSVTSRSNSKTGWSLEFPEGVPVVVHDSRPGKRSVHFIFAERGTGFPLWRDNHLVANSSYTCIDSDYHEFRSGDDLRVGLRFSAASAASKFLQQVVTLLSNPVTFTEEKKRNTTPKKGKLPAKMSISPPCCFSHRTHIAKEDELTSLSEFVGSRRKVMLDSRASFVAPSSKIYGTIRS